MMMKRFLPALLASAALTLSLAACNDASPSGASASTPDDVPTASLPDMPPPVDTTGGKKAPAPAADSPMRELTAQNATDDIKKMQPQL